MYICTAGIGIWAASHIDCAGSGPPVSTHNGKGAYCDTLGALAIRAAETRLATTVSCVKVSFVTDTLLHARGCISKRGHEGWAWSACGWETGIVTWIVKADSALVDCIATGAPAICKQYGCGTGIKK